MPASANHGMQGQTTAERAAIRTWFLPYNSVKRRRTLTLLPSSICYLVEGGHQAPSADNLQPWLFTWDGETLVLRSKELSAASEVFGRDSHCEALTMGAVSENIVTLAADAGMEGDWDLSRENDTFLRFKPRSVKEQVSLPVQHEVFSRHTNRFKFDGFDTAPPYLQELEGLSQGACKLRVCTAQAEIDVLADLVRRASSLRFRNRILHEWFGKTLRFTRREVEGGTGLDVSTIDLPPGGGLLLKLIMDWGRMSRLNAVGMYRLLSSIEAQAIRRSPGMLVVLGPRSEGVDAGRLMERAWLGLERHGLAAQPYYVVTDQLVRLADHQLPAELVATADHLQAASKTFLGDDADAFPHMLLRFGKASKEPPRSRRLPLDRVVLKAESNSH